MTRRDVAVLGSQPFLRGMPPRQVAELAGCCSHVSVPAGRRLFEEGSIAHQFWIIDAGRVRLDACVPGRGRVVIETLGRGDVLGLSWLLPPCQWRYGAVTPAGMQAFAFDAVAVRAACDAGPVPGCELARRFWAVVIRRLQAARARLVEAHARAGIGSGT